MVLRRDEMDKDLISRKAVQDMIDRIAEMHPYRQIGKPETYSEYNEAWEDAVNRIGAELNDLSSAQPEHLVKESGNLVKGLVNDCISRQAALQAMDTWDKFGCDPDGKLVRYDDDKHYIPYVKYEDMVNAVKNLPSAQPESRREWYMHGCRDAQRWIPFETREPDAEEKQEHPEWGFVLCGKLPQDGQRILVNIKCKGHEAVQMDEYNDDGRECYLYSGYDIATEATAWMPLPKPWREQE